VPVGRQDVSRFGKTGSQACTFGCKLTLIKVFAFLLVTNVIKKNIDNHGTDKLNRIEQFSLYINFSTIMEYPNCPLFYKRFGEIYI
jgi:hypothetical protein